MEDFLDDTLSSLTNTYGNQESAKLISNGHLGELRVRISEGISRKFREKIAGRIYKGIFERIS